MNNTMKFQVTGGKTMVSEIETDRAKECYTFFLIE